MSVLDHSRFDVVVVGAGPAGASCATLLARYGIRVLLCDKAKFPREKICGDCINPKCWDYFELLGISDAVAAEAEVVNGVKIAGRTGIVLEMPFASGVTQRSQRRHASSDSNKAAYVALKRGVLDSILVNRAVLDGATFRDAATLEAIDRDGANGGKWNARFKTNEGGESVNVECDVLVGADGRNSRVANLLISDSNESSKGSDRIGIQFIVKRPENLNSNILMFFFDGGYGGIVGVSAAEANVAMVVTRELARLATNDFSQFIHDSIHSNKYAKTTIPRLDSVGEFRTAFPITPRSNRYRGSDSYLIGDARRTSEPFTGEGIFYAMQDGFKAAGEISRSLGVEVENEVLSQRNRFWVNGVFSPILQDGRWVDGLLSFGSRHKTVADFVGRKVFE